MLTIRPLLARNCRQKSMCDVEDAVEIDGEDVVPVLGHGCRVAGNMVAAVDARVIDQDREVTVPANFRGDLLACVAVCHIEFHGRSFAPGRRNECNGFICAFKVDVEHDDARALVGIGMANGLPDARSATGDGRDVPCKKPSHSSLHSYRQRSVAPTTS